MIQLTLDEREARILAEVLQSYLSDLRMEIADTDRMDFREMLKEREAVLNRLLAELPAVEETSGS